MAYEVIKSEKVFNGKILDVFHDTISLPDGREAMREVVRRVGAAAIVPVDKDGNIIFVRQYRHPVKEEILELPAGTFETGEDPLVCAERELTEETGCTADAITLLFKMYTTAGFCSEELYVYLAQGLHEGDQNLDPDEFLSIEVYSLEQAVKMIFNGDIKDSKTIAGVLAYKEKNQYRQ